MGTIIALKANDRVYLATDRMKKRLDFYWRTKAEFNFKIHKLKGGILLGASGPLVETQKLYLNESWFVPPKGVPFDKKFIVTSIIPKYVALLDEYDLLGGEREDDEDKYPHSQSQFIIVKDNDVFVINSDFAVFSAGDCAFVASSDNRDFYDKLIYSLDKSNPEKFFTDFFVRASDFFGDVVEEYVVIDTKDMEFKLSGGTR
jgi:hypothetical protein